MNEYFFVSDVHLGLNHLGPVDRELKFASFLNSLPSQTKALYLLGDIFDFWYEYKNVIPRGFTRVLGALAALVDRGVDVYFFNGNHDIWTYNYLQTELGIKVLEQPYVLEIEGKRFCLGHGDGLGKGDLSYKFLNKVFKNKVLQFLFSSVHPRIAFGLAHSWSKHNRLSRDIIGSYRGEDERIVAFSNEFQAAMPIDKKIDFFIFGHYHYCIQDKLREGGVIFIMGEWIQNCDYLQFKAGTLVSKRFDIT